MHITKRLVAFIIICFTITAAAAAQAGFAVIPDNPRPGDPVTVAVSVPAREAILFMNGRQLSRALCFSVYSEGSQPGFMAAVLAVPTTAGAGDALIRINDSRGILTEIPITIMPRDFHSETLHLNPALTSLVSDPDPVRTAESNRLWQILNTTGNQIYHTGVFVPPVTSTRRTSRFGSRRINQYSDGRRVTSIHAGVDYGIPTGTEVTACGRGKVILSRARVLTGNSVIIEHAPGIYSIYYHLDSVIAEEGAIVETGQLIGLSGSTGFSTGPHLHWEIRVSTENTDPDYYTNIPIIDKELIISRIFNR
ncbi:MAG: M23 family metallopeptidase [Treponema sp.]|nr:M23 family metallopeptidase [Treponema sp.]